MGIESCFVLAKDSLRALDTPSEVAVRFAYVLVAKHTHGLLELVDLLPEVQVLLDVLLSGCVRGRLLRLLRSDLAEIIYGLLSSATSSGFKVESTGMLKVLGLQGRARRFEHLVEVLLALLRLVPISLVPRTDLISHRLDQCVLDAPPLATDLVPLHALRHGLSLALLLHVLLLGLPVVGEHGLGRAADELLVLAADSIESLLLPRLIAPDINLALLLLQQLFLGGQLVVDRATCFRRGVLGRLDTELGGDHLRILLRLWLRVRIGNGFSGRVQLMSVGVGVSVGMSTGVSVSMSVTTALALSELHRVIIGRLNRVTHTLRHCEDISKIVSSRRRVKSDSLGEGSEHGDYGRPEKLHANHNQNLL